MASEFDSDVKKLRHSSTIAATRALNLNPAPWTPAQRQSLENWSLILALIPDLPRWSPAEKQNLIQIIRAKSAPNELPYLRQTQQHTRLRSELLRLGSNQ